MQALTVLLIELSLDCVHLTVNKSHITSCVDRLIKWLESMKTVDAVSEGAYNVVIKVLSKRGPDDAAKKPTPHVRPAEELIPQGPRTMQQVQDLPQTYQVISHPPAMQHMDNAWPGSEAASGMFYFSQPDTGSFDQNTVPSSEHLAGPNAGFYEFGTSQVYTGFHETSSSGAGQWDWESMTVDEGGHGHGPPQYQGQNLGGGPPH